MTKIESKLSTEKYLSICSQVERTVAAIYEHWGNAPQFTEEVKKLWQVMRNEENDHSAQIEMLKRLTRGVEIGERTMSDNRLLKLAEFANQCLERVKLTPLTTRSSLALAIKLETAFMEFHAKQAFVCKDKELEKLFSNLSRNDREHTERLNETYKKLFDQGH